MTRRPALLLLLAAGLLMSGAPARGQAQARPKGHLVAVGGGGVPDVIVDQHHLKRQRQSRLISLVLEHPALVGVGIDERTAAIVSGSRFEVMGESSVLVIDARRAAIEPRPAGGLSAARNITIHVLTSGMGMEIGN